MNETAWSPKDFHNAFLDTALRDKDVATYYVNRSPDAAHDIVAEIKQAIDWEDSPGCYLFSGLRGAGKTTELKKLMLELEQENIPVFYCDAGDYLDLNEPEITQTELVFTALAGLSHGIEIKFGKNFLTESIWERTKRALTSDVELKPTLKMANIEAAFSLRDNPSFKKELIQFARASSQFFIDANTFAKEVADQVKAKTGQNKLVLIVDSLERLSAPSGHEQVLYDSLKDLFFNFPDRLSFPDITVIYTTPPYLHTVLPNIDQFYSGTYSLSNFKVMNKPEQGQMPEKNQSGIDKILEVVNRRRPDWVRYITLEIMSELAWLSGGNLRRMFSLIRLSIRKAELIKSGYPLADMQSEPITQAIVEETKHLHWLNAEDRKWLEHCKRESGNLAQHMTALEKDLPPIIRLFDHSLVLNYQNGSIWYQVPPIIYQHV